MSQCRGWASRTAGDATTRTDRSQVSPPSTVAAPPAAGVPTLRVAREAGRVSAPTAGHRSPMGFLIMSATICRSADPARPSVVKDNPVPGVPPRPTAFQGSDAGGFRGHPPVDPAVRRIPTIDRGAAGTAPPGPVGTTVVRTAGLARQPITASAGTARAAVAVVVGLVFSAGCGGGGSSAAPDPRGELDALLATLAGQVRTGKPVEPGQSREVRRLCDEVKNAAAQARGGAGGPVWDGITRVESEVDAAAREADLNDQAARGRAAARLEQARNHLAALR